MESRAPSNPFVGPRPIEAGERLFGRARELRELQHRLQARRIVLLHAPSGAGKSSLVNAGLIPRLRRQGYDIWGPVRLNRDPRERMDLPPETNRYLWSALSSLEEGLPPGERLDAAALARTDLASWLEAHRRPDRPILLIFDQFEELITIAPRARAEKLAFIDALGRALEAEHLRALFVLREEFLGALAPFRERLPTRLAYTTRLELLSRDAAREVALRLARSGGRAFPAVDRLIEDLARVRVQQPDGGVAHEIGETVEPVQLQVVCRHLWSQMPAADASIGEEDLARNADVTRTLGGWYAAIVREVADGDPSAERAIRDWVGRQLIVDGVRVQVRQGQAQSGGLDNALVAGLLEAHLVRQEPHDGSNWFELAHDRLLEAVTADNQAWEVENLHPLHLQARQWEDLRRPPELLLGEAALTEARAWAERHPALLTASERDYLALSGQRLLEQARRRRQTRALLLALAAAALLATLFGVLAWRERGEAIAQSNEANAQFERARRATLMAGAREMIAEGEPGVAAALLAVLPAPEQVEGFAPLALDLLGRGVPLWTLSQGISLNSSGLSPDGQRYAAVGADGVVRVLRADGRGEVVRLVGPPGSTARADWGPDSRQLVTVGQDGAPRIWSADGGEARVLVAAGSPIQEIRWSPDGRRIAGSAGTIAWVWTVEGAGQPQILDRPFGRLDALAWSPDGLRLATGHQDGAVVVWSGDPLDEERILEPASSGVARLAWSPDGRRLAAATEGGPLAIWSADGAGRKEERRRDRVALTDLRWSPDGGRLATASIQGLIRVWSADGAGDPIELSGHAGAVQSVRWSPDGRYLLSASADGTARIWQPDTFTGPVEDRATPTVLRADGPVWSTSWSPDGGRVFTASGDGTLRAWSALGTRSLVLGRGPDRVWSLDLSSDGRRVLAASASGTPWVTEVDGSGPLVALTGLRAVVNDARFSPDGRRVAAAALDGTLGLWSLDPLSGPTLLPTVGGELPVVRWSPDGSRVAAGGLDGTVRIWRADGQGEPVVLRGHTKGVYSVAWSSDGQRLATASDDGTARIWRADGQGAPVVLSGHTAPLWTVAWSPDGTRVLTSSDDGTARIWRADGQVEPVVLRGHRLTVNSASWSPDGTRVLTASADMTARIWPADGHGEPIVLAGHGHVVTFATWSPDGTRVFTGSFDHTARVWAADGRGVPLVLPESSLYVHAGLWSPDGDHVVLGGGDGTVSVWPLRPAGLQQALAGATDDCLGAEQRIRYLFEAPETAAATQAACLSSHRRPPPSPTPTP